MNKKLEQYKQRKSMIENHNKWHSQLETEKLKTYSLRGRILKIKKESASLEILFWVNAKFLNVVLTQGEKATELFESFVEVGDVVGFSGKWQDDFFKADNFIIYGIFIDNIKTLNILNENKGFNKKSRLVKKLIGNEFNSNQFFVKDKVIKIISDTLTSNGFIQITTPLITMKPAGGKSRLFETYSHYHKKSMYLRNSSELFLKQVMMGGIDRVFEFAHSFRNESEGGWNRIGFLMVEGQVAFERMDTLKKIFIQIFKKLDMTDDESSVLENDFNNLFIKHTGVDYKNAKSLATTKPYSRLGVGAFENMPVNRLALLVFKKYIIPKLTGLNIIKNIPHGLSVLEMKKDDEFTDKIMFVYEGVSIAGIHNSEINVERLLEEYDYENEQHYNQFVEDAFLGLMPALGFSISIERVIAILGGAKGLEDYYN